MKQHDQFKRRALLLFFIVSLMPSLTVSALWYSTTREGASNSYLTFGGFAAPVALIGILPAIILSIVFAEVLAIPIRRIHKGILAIGSGDLSHRLKFRRFSEFKQMADSLNSIAINLTQILSQKDSENKLLTSERNKLSSVLNNMQDGVLATDQENRVVLFNKAAQELTGRPLEEAAGKPLTEVAPMEHEGKAAVINWLNSHPKSGGSNKSWPDLVLTSSDGSDLQIKATAILLPQDPNGIRMLMTFQNLTKGKELEEMEFNFVALAAHQLRTPVTTIKNTLDVLIHETGSKLSKEHQKFLQKSFYGADKLSALIDNLLNVSRIEHGEVSYMLEPVDWHKFLRDTCNEAAESLSEGRLKIDFNFTEKQVLTSLDKPAMSEVIHNLLDNALRHIKEGDRVKVETKFTDKGIITYFSDTGTGIPKAAIKHLFEKFYRVGGLRSSGGTGLGLYICKSIIEAHGGYIWAESEPGKGSTFGFLLPTVKKVAQKHKKLDNTNIIPIEGSDGWIKKNPHN